MTELVRYEVDQDQIATITWDMQISPMNVLNRDSLAAFHEIVEKAIADHSVKGVVITSAKRDFIAGADLKMLAGAQEKPAEELLENGLKLQKLFRAMETSGKPFVAAINGTALGGGFEVCLACHHRIAADNPKAQIGLPEVKLGLLPGAGGTQRLPRLLGARDALPLLTEGKTMDPNKAKSKGLVHEVVPGDELLAAAKKWIKEDGTAKQPWDTKGYRIPGGDVQSPKGYETFIGGNAMLAKTTWGNYPAPEAIMSCVYHGLQMPIEMGLNYEARQFVKLSQGDVAQNMIRSLFFHLGDANKLKRRPKDVPTQTFKKVGIIGAGMMGAGIAYQSALRGIDVVLLDVEQTAAEKGKAYSEGILKKRVSRGRSTPEQAETILGRILPTINHEDLKGCEMVIEAVFENRDIKAKVTKEAEAMLEDTAIFASNTSTLPITGLAEASERPKNFIGLHFFSPVEKMPLVEVIRGKETSDEVLARSLDYVKQIKKTPIVVNDSRGFYTSRVFATYVTEGIAMLLEGVKPALIENAGRMAGMPVGPLALADEVSLDLMVKITNQTKADLGGKYQEHPSVPVVNKLVNEFKRLGKKADAGFYEYPEDEKKHLWSGLEDNYPVAAEQPDVETIKQRFLAIQVVETMRCMEEDVLLCAEDADIGSILGWGFCPFHGGVLSYAQTIGLREIVQRCQEFTSKYGQRFSPPALMVEMAEKGKVFYE